MRAIAAVAGKEEMAVGKPPQHDLEHLPHPLRRRFVPAALLFVVRRIAVQRDQDRQRPRPTGKGQRHQDGQHHPLVTVAKGGIGMGRTHGIAMATFAEDLLAAML